MTVTRPAPNGHTPESKTAESTAQTLEERLEWVREMHEDGVNLLPLTEGLLRENEQLQQALDVVRVRQAELREELEALRAPQLYPVVITEVHRARGMVEVHGGGITTRVTVHPDVPRDHLRVGRRAILARERNCVLEVQPEPNTWNEVGTFESYFEEGKRLLIRHQENLLAVTPTEELRQIPLKKGDLVGFNRDGAGLAFARVESPSQEHLFFEETPADRFEELGGLDREIALLQRLVCFRLLHSDVARRYKLPVKHGILFEGPPGNGKTKLARCLAHYIAELVPAGKCRFMAIAGSQDYSMWLGQSEQRIIARFEAARALASDGNVPVVMFFDEIDALGRRRGADVGSTATDRILSTFLAQLDGMQRISNLIVIGATNRADVLDPALLRPGRLGDVRVRITAPNRQGGRAILTRYLAEGLPVVGEVANLVETVLSRIYSPQSDYAELARVKLRDGRMITVGARDLVSGAMFEKLVRMAAEEAAEREMVHGQGGITEADLMNALDRELRSLAGLLSPGNVRNYTTRLPQDVDPVTVEPFTRLHTAAALRSL